MVSLNDIQKVFRGELKLYEPLASHTSYRIGGPADYYLEPRDKDEMVQLVNYFRRKDFPFVIMGNGGNVLVSDQGYRGAVISLENALSRVCMDGPLLYVETGVKLAKLVDFCVHRSLKGMETLAGISGTLGVALTTNAAAHGTDISANLVEVETLRNGELVRIQRGESGFSLPGVDLSGDVTVAGWFLLSGGKKEELIRARREWLVKRNQTQPVNTPGAGSIFRNPPGQLASTLIEDAGLKGLRHGGAMVSLKHANTIVHVDRANAQDVLALIKKVQRAVQKKFKITLEPEVTLLGFDQVNLREVA